MFPGCREEELADLSSQSFPPELGESHKGRTTGGPEGGIDLEGLGGGR